MATLEQEIKHVRRSEPKKVSEFSQKFRTLTFYGLEKGDQFTIPTDYEIWEEELNGTTLQYINITLTSGVTKHLYPAVFRKMRTVYNEDGTSTGKRVFTDGTAAKLFQSFDTIQEGMNALRGKTLKVTDVKTVRTLRYGTTSLMNAQIPTIDIVE